MSNKPTSGSSEPTSSTPTPAPSLTAAEKKSLAGLLPSNEEILQVLERNHVTHVDDLLSGEVRKTVVRQIAALYHKNFQQKGE